MGYVEDIRRAITVGFTYDMYVPFVLAGHAYIAIGKVCDREHDYVCIWVDKSDVPMNLQLVTLTGSQPDVVPINSGDEPLRIEGDRFANCNLLMAMMTGMFHQYGHEVAGDPMANLKVLGEVTVKFAQAAGVFNSRSAYDDLMAFGERSDRAMGRKFRNPQARQLRDLRRACKPDDPATWLEYATVLITASSLEVLLG